MGFFDRFRKRVKEVADDTDLDSLTVDEDSEEAQEAIAKRQQIKEEQEKQSETPEAEVVTSSDDDWEDVEEIEAISAPQVEEEEWDDLEDEPIPEPISPSLDKKQRKRLEKEAKEAKKERQRLKKEGFDVDQEVRPDGSKVDLQIMRSTTGRKLVEVKSAPRGSTGPTAVETETGKTLEIDLGGGVVETGGKIIKGGEALDAMLEELELVITALRNELVGNRLRKGADLSKVVEASLKRALRTLLSAGYWDFDATVDSLLESGDLPVVIMMVGVNGTGKTTTTAKIAYRLKNKGRKVVLAASDTFRAGAIDQLEIHAERLDIRCISSQRGGDAAAIARDAIEHAKARKMDVVIVDTAGRMQNKLNLMEELRKVHRVTKPHLVLFVGDALAGNDAVEQAKEFQRMLKFDGAVLCKLDTDAKGGAALSIAHATDKPIVLAGVGQEYDDLKQFDPDWLIEEVFT
ncbi:MAG TPA: signal recognition particle-docking protein FtsY [Candidatus Poseidoniales archaeon]|nr:signal recognition particle-docking protein FtsY [Candidatus Poseidoniales archaeon]